MMMMIMIIIIINEHIVDDDDSNTDNTNTYDVKRTPRTFTCFPVVTTNDQRTKNLHLSTGIVRRNIKEHQRNQRCYIVFI